MYVDTERLNMLAVMPNDAQEFGRQAAIQIALFTQIETAKGDVDGFIDTRADDDSPIASIQPLISFSSLSFISFIRNVLRNLTQTQQFHQQTSEALAQRSSTKRRKVAEIVRRREEESKMKQIRRW